MQVPRDGTKRRQQTPIDGGLRNKLTEGTSLVARYKGTAHRTRVVTSEDGKLLFRLDNGRTFKSPSSAGSAVMEGVACNGWRFWSIDDGAAPATKPRAAKKPAATPTAELAKPAATEPGTTPATGGRPRCPRCGKQFVSGQRLAHHDANAGRLCRPA